MTKTLDPDRLERFLKPGFHLRSGSGAGVNGKPDACFLQAVDWLTGGNGKTDAPACVDPMIRRFSIGLNDAPRFAEYRDELKDYAVRVVGTKTTSEATRQRAFMCADWAIRTITPQAFEFWAQASPKRAEEAREWAQQLRDVATIVDEKSARAGRDVARTARAYAAADDAAFAYAAYAAAAYAADADVDARAAAYAADAAAPRSNAKAFSRQLWDESLAFLDRLILVTEGVSV
jgi:hypothetical protein